MPKYRKKPVVIEAMQYDGTAESFDRIWGWLCPSDDTLLSPVHCDSDRPGEPPGDLSVDTLEGEMTARAGDWIIRGVVGEVYPCKPAVFAATYEEVRDA